MATKDGLQPYPTADGLAVVEYAPAPELAETIREGLRAHVAAENAQDRAELASRPATVGLTALDLCYALGALERELREHQEVLEAVRDAERDTAALEEIVAERRERVARFRVAWSLANEAEVQRTVSEPQA